MARHKHVLARMGVRTPAELISEFDANKDGFLEAEEVDALRSRISNYEQVCGSLLLLLLLLLLLFFVCACW